MNNIYTLFVMLHMRWSGNAMLWSFSFGNLLLSVMRVLLCVIIVAESSILSMASNIFWRTLDGFMTEFDFSGLISRVHFVVNLLLITVAVVACSMLRFQTIIVSLSARIA